MVDQKLTGHPQQALLPPTSHEVATIVKVGRDVSIMVGRDVSIMVGRDVSSSNHIHLSQV